MASEPFAPSRIGLGWQVLERGASGFTGWTEGLRRTQDAAALKRMYKAKRPDDVATLQVELAVEGALEVDEVGGLDDEEEGEGDAGGVEQEEDGDESEEEEEGLAMHAAIGGGTRPSKRAVRRAFEAESDLSHLIFNRRADRRASSAVVGAGLGGAALQSRATHHPECTSCHQPLYECVLVCSHPLLGVAVCLYCYEDAGGKLASDGTPLPPPSSSAAPTAAPFPTAAPVAEGSTPSESSSDSDVCCWCHGNCHALGSSNLFMCDGAECGRAVCEGCVRLNLGTNAVDAVRAEGR